MSLDIAGAEYLDEYQSVNKHAKMLQEWDVQLVLLGLATTLIGLVPVSSLSQSTYHHAKKAKDDQLTVQRLYMLVAMLLLHPSQPQHPEQSDGHFRDKIFEGLQSLSFIDC
jgi:hypothetical protein